MIGSKLVSWLKFFHQFKVNGLTINLIQQLKNQETTKNHTSIKVYDQPFIPMNPFNYHNNYKPIQTT